MRYATRILALCVFLGATVLAEQNGAPMGPVVPAPSTLIVEGIPPIPQSLADAVAPYASFRQVVFASWHPTERQMLVNTRLGDVFQPYLLASPQAELQSFNFPKGSIGSAQQPGNGSAWFVGGGRFIVFAQDEGGNQAFQFYRKDRQGGSITLLTDGRSRNERPVWSTAGDRMAYASTRRNTRDRDIWVMNPAHPESDRIIAELPGVWTPLDWSHDDSSLLAMETISRAETRIWQLDVKTGEKKQLTPDGTVAYGGGVFSRDGRSVYLTSDANGEFRKLARLELATGRITPLAPSINWDINDLALSASGRLLAFVANEAGAGVLYLLDTRSGRARRVKGLPAGSVGGMEWHPKLEELSFNLRSTKSPWSVFSLEPKSGAVHRWSKADTGPIDTSQLADAELIRWKSFDGRMISGFLYRPPARFKGPRAVVVNIHGGPEDQETPRFLGRSNYLLNELGVAIIYPNIRGSAGFGKSFLALDNGALRENAVKDIGALLDWIARQKALDSKRVNLTGASYGGTMALAAAAMYPDRVRCVFDGFGMSNIATFLDRLDPSIKPVRRGEYGDESDPAMRAFMQRIAPVNNVDKMRMPLFIAHGRNDVSVPVQEAEQMVAAARNNGTPVWVMYATNSGHGFANSRANDDYSFYTWVLFLKEHLLQ